VEKRNLRRQWENLPRFAALNGQAEQLKFHD
jgi:hypothetical protein